MKRLLHKWFPSFFQVNETRYIDVSGNNNLQVKLINPDGDGMHNALGITDERRDQLAEMIRKSFVEHRNSIVAVAELGDELKHPNELFFITMRLSVDLSNVHNAQHQREMVNFN